MEWLKGKKTYLVAAAVAVLSVLHTSGTIDTELYNTLVGILSGLGLATLRAAVK